MKLTATSTEKIVTLTLPPEACGEVPARVWDAVTDAGVPCLLFVTRVLVDQKRTAHEQRETFARELQEQTPPTRDIEVIPFRMIL